MTTEQRLKIYRELRSRLGSSESPVCEPVSSASINAFEAKHGSVPSDFREWLFVMNGMEDGVMEEKSQVRLWPLEELTRDDSQIIAGDRVFLFADFLLSSHEYSLRFGGTGTSDVCLVVGDGKPPISICSSFADFVELMLQDSSKLY